jgi:hypothetical protein
MFSSVQKLSATFVIATSLASVSSLAMAAPVTNGSAIRNATPSTVETVRWWGWGAPAAAFVAGGLIGGALAAPYYYGYGPYYGAPYAYYPGPYYPGPYAAAPPAPAAPAYSSGGGEDYCAQRFRSYDPSTGTYLGYDGQRHPCP